MSRIKIGIDGCGTLTSSTILPHLLEKDFMEFAEVTAVCDIVPERAEQAASQYGVRQHFGSLDAMLSESDIEVVLVIVPHAIHGEHARKIVQSRRHVYVQKPMAPSLAEGRALLAEADAAGVHLVAAPGQCLWPMYDRIREVIQDGAVGPVYWAMPPMMGWGGRNMEFPTDPSWFFSDEGGPFRDHGGYGFQSLVQLFGPARRISSMMGTGLPERQWRNKPFPITGPDNTVSILDFGQSRFGLMPECWSDTAPSVRFFRILGLEGSIETDPETFNGLDILPIGATVRPMGKTPFRIEVPLESVEFTRGAHPHLGHTHVYGDILQLVHQIRGDIDPIDSGARALHFVDAVECAFESARTGQAVEFRTTLPDWPG